MGFLDLFRSPEKQLEIERKLLEKPNRTVAVCTHCRDWEDSESVTLDDGSSDIRSFTVEEADFSYRVDGEVYEYTTQPREGRGSFHVGEQWIICYDARTKRLASLERQVRTDSPFCIKL